MVPSAVGLLFELYDMLFPPPKGPTKVVFGWEEMLYCRGGGELVGDVAATLCGEKTKNQSDLEMGSIGPFGSYWIATYMEYSRPWVIPGQHIWDYCSRYRLLNTGDRPEQIPRTNGEPWPYEWLPPDRPSPFTDPYPLLDPHTYPPSLPVAEPGPAPRPIPPALLPERVPNEWRSPTESAQWGPLPRWNVGIGWWSTEVDPWPPVVVPGRVDPPFVIDPELPPVSGPSPAAPAQDVSAVSTRRGPVSRSRSQHKFKRPGRRTKERKIYVSAGSNILRWALEASMEGVELIQSFHDALPRDMQAHKRTGVEMGKALYRHWNDVDMCGAMENVANNQIEDWLYGRIGHATKLAQKQGVLPPSLRLAPVRHASGSYADLQNRLGLTVEFDCQPAWGQSRLWGEVRQAWKRKAYGPN